MRTKLKIVKKGLALLLTVVMVLTLNGVTELVSAACPDGWIDWSRLYSVKIYEIKDGKISPEPLKDGATISADSSFHVVGTIGFENIHDSENAVMTGDNITKNYLGKKCYVSTVSDGLEVVNFKPVHVTDETGEVSFGTIKIENGIIGFEFDTSTEPKHIANEAYNGLFMEDIQFSYDIKFSAEFIKELGKKEEVDFHDTKDDTFKLIIEEYQPHAITVAKAAEKEEYTGVNDKSVVNWSITLTNQGQKNGGNIFTITDTFDPQIPPIEGTFTVDAGEIVPGSINIDKVNNTFTLKYKADDSFYDSDLTDGNNVTRTIRYQSEVHPCVKSLIGWKSQLEVFSNKVSVTCDQFTDEIKDASASIRIHNTRQNLLKKYGIGVPDIDLANNKATAEWEISVNTYNLFGYADKVWVEDKMQQPLTYLADTLEISVNDGAYVNYEALTGYTVDCGTRKSDKNTASYLRVQTSEGPTYFREVKDGSEVTHPGTARSRNVPYLGGIDLKDFVSKYTNKYGALADPVNVTFKIRYKTVIENYEKYLEEYENGENKLNNYAQLWFDMYNYNGDGLRSYEVAGWTGLNQNFVNTGISKYFSTIDRANHTIKWAIDVDNKTAGNVTVTDILPAGLDYIPSDAKLKIQKYNKTTKEYEDTTEYSVSDDAATTIEGNDSNTVTFTILKGGSPDKLNDRVRITFYTSVHDVNVYAVNGKHDYTNTAVLKLSGKEMARAKAMAIYESEVISKLGGADYVNGGIKWSVTVNENKMKMDKVTVVDSLPSGTIINFDTLTYTIFKEDGTEVTSKITDKDVNGLYYVYDSDFASDGSKGKLTLHLPNFATGEYGRISYSVDIDTNSKELASATATLKAKVEKDPNADGTGHVKFTNKAELTSEYEVDTKPTADASVDYKFKEVKKNAIMVNGVTAEYSIGVNSAKMLLEEHTAYEDQMSYGMYYKREALEIFEGAVNDNDEVYVPNNPTKLVEGVDYSVTFDTYKDKEGRDCEYMLIELLKATNKALYISYSATIPDSSVAEEYYNVFKKGEVKYGKDSEKKITKQEVEEAKAFARVATNHKAYLTKTVDGEDNIPVQGAEYGLYSGPDCKDSDLIRKDVTDAGGHITFYDLKPGEVYYVKEISAPENFEIDDTIHKVVVRSDQERYEIQAKDKRTPRTDYSIELTKVEEGTDNVYLEGAVFGLYSDKECKDIIQRHTTDETGVITFANLTEKTTYYIKEIEAPEGYVLDETVREVKTDDKVTPLIVENKKVPPVPYSLIIRKVDSDDNTILLGGAEFGLYSDEACTDLIESMTTDETGTIVFAGLEQDTTYYVKELAAPDEYELDETVRSVRINEELTVLTVTNTKGEVLGEEFENPDDPDDPEVLGEEFIETGDSSPIVMWIMLLLLGLVAAAFCIFRIKKEDTNK